MNPHKKLKLVIDLLIYLSVALGPLLLVQIYRMVSQWLFYSVLVGWIAFLVVAVGAASGRKMAYPSALVLAAITPIVSLPQPAHSALLGSNTSLPALTLMAGSALQICLLVLIPIYIVKGRSVARQCRRRTAGLRSKSRDRSRRSPTSAKA